MTESTPPDYGLEPLTRLSHALIRKGTRDDLDPFMLPGNLVYGQNNVAVRACFYYAVAVTPQHIVLFDNWGEGGMCKLAPHEMRAVWSTPEVLEGLGTTLEELNLGTAVLPQAIALPAPHEVVDDITDNPKDPPSVEGPSSFEGYAGRASLRALLKSDMGLFGMWIEQAPEPVVTRMAERLEAKRRSPKMG